MTVSFAMFMLYLVASHDRMYKYAHDNDDGNDDDGDGGDEDKDMNDGDRNGDAGYEDGGNEAWQGSDSDEIGRKGGTKKRTKEGSTDKKEGV